MSLTPEQVNAIKRYLGYTLVPSTPFRGDGAWTLDNNITQLTADGVTAIQDVLAELAALDAAIVDARDRLQATQVGDIRLDGRREIRTLRSERDQGRRDLAKLLGVNPPAADLGPGVVIV